MTVSVRLLCLADVPKVLALQAQCYEPQLLESASAFAAKLAAAQDCRCSWIALRGEAPLAYAVALPVCLQNLPALNASHVAVSARPDLLYFHDLAVAPDGRSLGLGHGLVDRVMRSAQALGLARIGLIAVQGSRTFWQRQGFEAQDALPPSKLASFGADAVWMERQLRPAPSARPAPQN